MKDFNYAYKNLKDQANQLKNTHFQQSGKLEIGEIENTQIPALLIKELYSRYSADWQNFEKTLISDAINRGYDIQSVLQNFPQPILPEETIDVGITGDWESYDG